MRILLTAAMALGASLGAAEAATIIGAQSVTPSSERGNVPAINTIDQSGLSVGYTSGVDDFDAYLALDPTHTTNAAFNEWFSDFGNLTATLTFDLGAVFTVDRVALWVEESSGFSTAALSSSTDGVSFGGLGTINPIDNPLADYPAEVFGFSATAMRYFRMEMSGCPQPDPGATDECSLGEIAFSSTTATPIPVPGAGLLLASAMAAGAAFSRRARR